MSVGRVIGRGIGVLAVLSIGALLILRQRDELATVPSKALIPEQQAVASARATRQALITLPAAESAEFCVVMQQRMADTHLVGKNTVFFDMASFRHSKPSVQPLRIYQVVTYAAQQPIMVSCKMKSAAQLRAVYGLEAAGSQQGCADVTREIQSQAIQRLRAGNQLEAATRAAALVVNQNPAYVTGRAYLKSFPLSHVGPDGHVHLSSIGLFQDYDSWVTALLPKILQGQSYCHVPTAEYLMALASGTMLPGTVVTTADDAIVTPAERP